VFKNRVLRRIFGPKRDEVTGGWRKLRNEELHNLYSSPNTIFNCPVEEDEMGAASNTQGEKVNAYRILGGKTRNKEKSRKT
jgi:hypothetical protein